MPDIIAAGSRARVGQINNRGPFTIPNGYVGTVSNSAAATIETVYLTSSTMILKNGRAYRVTLSHLLSGTQPDLGRLFVKRTNTGGSVLFDNQAIAIPRSGNNGRITESNIATNTTGADISTVLVATFQRVTGTAGNLSVPASTTSPAYLHVEDVGPASDFSPATPIT
jgi:hypothetical protein